MLRPLCLLFSLLAVSNAVNPTFPRVDFDRMGKVGLAGAFAGLDVFSNTSTSVSFDPSTSSLLSRSTNGSLSFIASTNSGGRISAGCVLDDTYYFSGFFSSVNSMPASNVASYNIISSTIAALSPNEPNGEIDALFCDEKDNKLWVGGNFKTPSASVAVWDTKAKSWAPPPFVGVTGAQSRVMSITSNSSNSSLFFAGSFFVSFGNASAPLNNTNNPNVPFSPGATPFSSSLVPIPLQRAQIDGSPSTSDPNFEDIQTILCPSGPDGPHNSWFSADGTTALITVRAFMFISVSGIRLGNTFQENHRTTGFSVTTIPDNKVQTLHFVEPTTGQNQTCSDPCPLSTDSSVLYQDYLFDSSMAITGVQIKLSGFSGASSGLHILQLLSSGAFASSIDSNNGLSCFAPNPSNTSRTGDWEIKQASTEIAGTIQSVLVSSVNVGTPPSEAPSHTWIPYVSASGDYDVNMLIPGCLNFQDCPLRTDVKVTIFPGEGLQPSITKVSQQNTEDATILLYSGPILPSSPDFVTTITMTLADDAKGSGQNGKFELVADRVQIVLKSANISSSTSGGATTPSSIQDSNHGFGFIEWPRSSSASDGTQSLPKSSQTSLDSIGLQFVTDGITSIVGSQSSINAVVHHPSGVIFLAGSFNLSAGSANGATNIVAYKNGVLSALSEGGLNGQVTSLLLQNDQLFVGGSFHDTSSGSMHGKLGGIASYNVGTGAWSALASGVNGSVFSLGSSNGQVQVVGNFTGILTPSGSVSAAGFSVWDINHGNWINSGGFLVGSMTFVGNGKTSQFLAGNVVASKKFGASGMVMLSNGDGDEPRVTPLGVQFSESINTSTINTANRRRRSHHTPRTTSWLATSKLPQIFARQSNNQPASLPSGPVTTAPAVLAGTFWTNSSSSKELIILGGNFSFAGSQLSTVSQGVAIYDPESTTVRGLNDPQVNGTVRALFVDGDKLYVGGQFTLSNPSMDGLAIYDLSKDAWVTDLQSLHPSSGSSVVVRSISSSSSKENTVIVAGSFAQAGSLVCQSVCSLDSSNQQWNTLGSGIQGEVASVTYAGKEQEYLIVAGSIALSGNTANVAQYSFSNNTWSVIGSGLPGPVTAIEVNNGNGSSIFAAGRSIDGSSTFLSFWNGIAWSNLGSTLQQNTSVAQLTMVPLQDTHSGTDIIEADRMLMVSGLLSDSSFGNASCALYDGQTLIPYIVSSSSMGLPGVVAAIFRSFATFSFDQRHFLATGVVILISIAIAAGIVFLLALVGILWTLFARRDNKLNKFDPAEDEDDDSMHHRPSSLLEHINAATRTTILGASPFGSHTPDKEEEKTDNLDHHDPFGPDASNYVRAVTPDAMGGMLAEELSRPAHARYSFDGTGEGELPMSAGTEVEVLDDRDPAWWYARDVRTGREGVVPAAYLY